MTGMWCTKLIPLNTHLKETTPSEESFPSTEILDTILEIYSCNKNVGYNFINIISLQFF